MMDHAFLVYNALSRTAIEYIKSLPRKDPRFLQMLKVRLTSHSKNLEQSGMGYRIKSDDMVREEWIPLLTENAREDWLKVPPRQPPLWPHFMDFLEIQAAACPERERLGLNSKDNQPAVYCAKCKTSTHKTPECKAQFCLECKTWGKCKNRNHRKLSENKLGPHDVSIGWTEQSQKTYL